MLASEEEKWDPRCALWSGQRWKYGPVFSYEVIMVVGALVLLDETDGASRSVSCFVLPFFERISCEISITLAL